MTYGHAEYSAIKGLLYKFGLEFKNNKDYQEYINDLIGILKI